MVSAPGLQAQQRRYCYGSSHYIMPFFKGKAAEREGEALL